MFGLIISDKIYSYVMNKSNTKHKILYFCFLDGLYLMTLFGIILLIMSFLVPYPLSNFQMIAIGILWVVTGAIGSVIDYILLRRGNIL